MIGHFSAILTTPNSVTRAHAKGDGLYDLSLLCLILCAKDPTIDDKQIARVLEEV